MSTFIGKVGGKPFMHMTSDTKTEANMQGAPSSTTLFHSDLPYVFAREQWEIDTYTDWNGTGGGRKFALPAEAQTFRANNPDLAYIVILEDVNGHTTIVNPCLNVHGSFWQYVNPNVDYKYSAATVGSEYTIAFTDSDSQLTALSRNPQSGTWGTTRELTFRIWDSNDTSVTVFRHQYAGTWVLAGNYAGSYYGSYARTHFADQVLGSFETYMYGNAKDTVSDGLDIVKVRVVALNVTNSPSTFSVQTGYDDTAGITISNDEFSVGGVNLLESAPIISRGVQNSGTTVTPVYGSSIGGKVVGVNTSIKTSGKVSDTNVVQDNNTPVLEIPDPIPATPSAVFDFKNQTFTINGENVFSSAGASEGLIYSGYKTLDFSLDVSFSGSTNNTVTVSSTSSGSFSNADANTLYLLTFKYTDVNNNAVMTPVAIVGVGDNEVFTDVFNANRDRSSPYGRLEYHFCFYINIDSSGNLTVKRQQYQPFAATLNVYLGDIQARLIALNPA